jgi:hypothetical protein
MSMPSSGARTGTLREARIAAFSARKAALSILVEMPIEQPEDESILLDLLHSSHWDVAGFQRKRLAQRMARYVSDCIMRKPFKPMRPGAAH